MAHIIGQGEVAACIIAMPPTFIGAALQLGGEVKVNLMHTPTLPKRNDLQFFEYKKVCQTTNR